MNPEENIHSSPPSTEFPSDTGDWNPESVPPPALPFPLEEAMDTPENARIFHEAMLRWIKERVAEVEAILLDYDAFDLIANFTLREMGRDPETYTEPTHDGMAAIVEYVALLFLKHPYNHAKKMVLDPKVVPEVRERLLQIIASLQFAHGMTGPLLAPDRTGEGTRNPELSGFRAGNPSAKSGLSSPRKAKSDGVIYAVC